MLPNCLRPVIAFPLIPRSAVASAGEARLERLTGELGDGLALGGGDRGGPVAQRRGHPEGDLRRTGRLTGERRPAIGSAHVLEDLAGDPLGESLAAREPHVLAPEVDVGTDGGLPGDPWARAGAAGVRRE